MLQSEDDSAKAAHGDANDGAFVSRWGRGKSLLNIADEVFDDVIFVAVLRLGGGIHVIGRIAFRHDQDESVGGILRHVRVIRPVSEAATTTVQKVKHRELSSRSGVVGGKDNAVGDLALQSGTEKGNVLHGDTRGEARVVNDWRLLFVTGNQKEANQ